MGYGIKPVDMEATLNYMYKYLPAGSTRRLENFNGRRYISLFRGKNFLTKTTHKLDPDRPLVFYRTLKNIGTKDEPKMVTSGLLLRAPDADMFVYYDKLGSSMDGIHIDITRRKDRLPPYQQFYENFMAMRQDKRLMQILEDITGKKLTR